MTGKNQKIEIVEIPLKTDKKFKTDEGELDLHEYLAYLGRKISKIEENICRW